MLILIKLFCPFPLAALSLLAADLGPIKVAQMALGRPNNQTQSNPVKSVAEAGKEFPLGAPFRVPLFGPTVGVGVGVGVVVVVVGGNGQPVVVVVVAAARGSWLVARPNRLGSAQLDSPRSFALKFTRLKVACQVGGQNALIVWPQSCF